MTQAASWRQRTCIVNSQILQLRHPCDRYHISLSRLQIARHIALHAAGSAQSGKPVRSKWQTF